MRRLLCFLLFLSCLAVGGWITHKGRYRDAFRAVCDLTAERFYKPDHKLRSWLRTCRKRADHVSWFTNETHLLRDIQDLLNELQVSHLQVYDPHEDRRLWKGESIDTGIRSRYVEDSLVVYRVEKQSAAESAGVRKGDEILKISGAEQVTPWGAMRRTGQFLLKRYHPDSSPTEIPVEIQAKTLRVDASPRLEKLDGRTALLEIDSFRAEFFEPSEWRKLIAPLNSFEHVIVDVRENTGGSFVAMLRALSTFHCGGKRMGSLVQPRKSLPVKESFDDNASDAHQIEELSRYRSLGLVTFDDYGCFQGRTTVLVGPETSSVAEIFAHSFYQRPKSRVWGQPTAGDVILAVWYELPMLGPGYSFSIPEAVYLTNDREELEGRGVTPQKELYHELTSSLAGKDSWIEAARK